MRKRRIVWIMLLTIAAAVVLTACGSRNLFYPLTHGAEDSDTSMLVVRQGDLFGYADTTGKVVIEPKYEYAGLFYEGLAAVKYNGKYGYIDKTGNTALSFQYVDVTDFHYGKAFAATGYVEYEYSPHNSTSTITEKYPKYCLIDRDGNILRETDYTSVIYVGDVMDADSFRTNGTILLDKKYNETLLPYQKYNEILTDFSEGLAVYHHKDRRIVSYVGYDGKIPFERTFSEAGPFSEGLAAVCEQEDKYGYINKKGEYVIEPQYQYADRFIDGLAFVITDGGSFAMIDTAGKVARKMEHPAVTIEGSFSEGFCAVKKYRPEKYDRGTLGAYDIGFMDTTGAIVIDCIYREVTPFNSGIAQVRLWDGKIGYIDRTGKYIWEPK
jgi:hypothetical protein